MPDHDAELRAAALASMQRLINRHGPILPWNLIAEGFEFRGERVLFANRARGIFRPKIIKGAELSIKTTVPKAGRIARYDDLASDDAFVYRFQGDDPDTHDNVALEHAWTDRAPMIYLYGVAPGQYLVLAPVFVSAFDRVSKCCEVVVGEVSRDDRALEQTDVFRRKTNASKRAWEHAILRFRTLDAWQSRCAVCELSTPSLLDASLVWPEAARPGVPDEGNALPLCVLHQGVFDRDLLGVDPAGRVVLADPLLRAIDGGVVLDQALKPFHGRHVRWPALRPRDEYVRQRHQRFSRAA
jgi:putative restriction endonuclease